MDWLYPPAITTGVPATKQPPPPTHCPFEQLTPGPQQVEPHPVKPESQQIPLEQLFEQH